jgi:hypothetical protein
VALLADLLGIRLLLWTGRTIATPPSPEVIRALNVAEVTQQDDGDGFQLTFVLAKDQLFDFPLLRNGELELFNRVVVAVVMGAMPEVLIDGVITHHQLDPHPEPGRTTLTVTGKDVTLLMDLEERNESFPNQPDFVIVGQILARYPELALIPQLTPTPDLPIQIQRIPRQAETDLAFIRRLARRNGFVFHVNPVLPGVNHAVFAPELRLSLPLPALTMNSVTSDNVSSLSFSHDGMAAVGASGVFVEPITKLPIPIPPLPSLKIPPLVTSPTPARRREQLRQSANETPSRAIVSALARVTGAPDTVTCTGTVDTTRYGSVMRARRLVGVRGAGLSYDGFYYVRQVTHRIELGRYTQSFSISREGTGNLLPAVVP